MTTDATQAVMTIDEMQALFTLILASWPTQRQKLNELDIEAMAKAYSAGLIDLDPHIAEDAVIRLVRTSKWMPTVAEIREVAGVVKFGHRRTGTEAWGEVLSMMRTYGSYRWPGVDFHFDDPVTAQVVSALNWAELCRSEGDMIISDRARFIDTYDRLATTARQDAAARPGVVLTSVPLTRELPPAERKVLASGEDRSKMLRDIIERASHEVKAAVGELVSIAPAACTCATFDPAADGRCRGCGAGKAA